MSKEIVAVDIGGTYMRFALIKNGKVEFYNSKDTPKTKEKILELLCDGIKEYKNDIEGIGVSCAGVIENGIIRISPNLPLKNFNIKKYIQKKFKSQVKIENDANCAAIAEAKLGVKKKNFIILTLGTGIGGGIIIDGKLYTGRGSGGELGHIVINDGKDLEYFAGTKAIKRLIKKYCRLNPEYNYQVINILNEKSTRSEKIKDEIAEYIGMGIASLISVFDPEIVVLAGGLRNLGESFLNKIKARTKKYAFLPRNPRIVWTKLKHPNLLGASLLFD